MSDGELILSFHNTHEAIMGERKLLDSGVPVQVMPMPKPIGPACGMCLRLPLKDIEKAQGLLGETIAGIYRRAGETGQDFIVCEGSIPRPSGAL
ncbi:hypothetical protein FACS189491_02100 [Spirochaetia bacterium]|nr:hypothetical protein FACS189491_02100 [Spirochaetia bacterium]